jgi:hypothetical protein
VTNETSRLLYPPSSARRCRHRHKMKHTNLKPHIPLSHPLLKKKKSHTRYQKKLIPPVLRPKGLNSSTRRPDVYHIRQHRIHGDAPILSLTSHNSQTHNSQLNHPWSKMGSLISLYQHSTADGLPMAFNSIEMRSFFETIMNGACTKLAASCLNVKKFSA